MLTLIPCFILPFKGRINQRWEQSKMQALTDEMEMKANTYKSNILKQTKVG